MLIGGMWNTQMYCAETACGALMLKQMVRILTNKLQRVKTVDGLSHSIP
jgi:hypothetical protein